MRSSRNEALERKRRKARQKIDEVEEKAAQDRGRILAALKQKMVQSVKNETLFTIAAVPSLSGLSSGLVRCKLS